MAIKKQEFYEGAALHILARAGRIRSIRFEAPFFLLNDRLLLHLKYCTRSRSPWGFTFTPTERAILQERTTRFRTMIGLVCGADGVAAVDYAGYVRVVGPGGSAVRISCYRQYGEYYEIFGPCGVLDRKIPPSLWQRVLDQ